MDLSLERVRSKARKSVSKKTSALSLFRAYELIHPDCSTFMNNVGQCLQTGKAAEEFLYDTSENKFRVWSIRYKQAEIKDYPEAKM